jgi:hypothetical protein
MLLLNLGGFPARSLSRDLGKKRVGNSPEITTEICSWRYHGHHMSKTNTTK